MTDRELDALVAEKVMNLTVVGEAYSFYESLYVVPMDTHHKPTLAYVTPAALAEADGYYREENRTPDHTLVEGTGYVGGWHVHALEVVPHYSTSIADAWKVVGAMWEKGWRTDMIIDRETVTVRIWRDPGEPRTDWLHTPFAQIPRGLCLAALRALGVET